MRFDVITCVPSIFESPLQSSILNNAQTKNLVSIHIHDLRNYTKDKHRTVDDYPFGGSSGMVLKIEPIAACIRELKSQRDYDDIIYLTPEGQTFNQRIANQISLYNNIILLAGHYKGVDQRVRDLFITKEISIGDYVLSGGELAVLVMIDAISRLIPGVLGDATSALSDSFQDNLLAPPVYTRPANFEGHEVPEVLTSGHFQKINQWNDEEAVKKTMKYRPDLLQSDED